MYLEICLGDISFTRKQYITNTGRMKNNSGLNYEQEALLKQALAFTSAPTHS